MDVEKMKNDIISNVKATMKDARKYYKQFDKYNFLWTVDKDEYLKEFLTYGRLLTADERTQMASNNPPNIRVQAPELSSFSSQVNFEATCNMHI